MPNTREKKKDAEALYNTHELVIAAQQAYSTRFDQHISVEKIRFLYTMLFELIMQSLARGERVDLYKFGIFKKTSCKPHVIPHVLGSENSCYVPTRHVVHFRQSQRFKDILDDVPVEPIYHIPIDEYEEQEKRAAEDAAFLKKSSPKMNTRKKKQPKKKEG